MARDQNTDHYEVHLEISIQPINKYGDTIADGHIIYHAKTTENDLAGLGDLLTRIQVAVQGKGTGNGTS